MQNHQQPLIFRSDASGAGAGGYDPGYSLEKGRLHVELEADGSYVETKEYVWRVDAAHAVDASGMEYISYVESLSDLESIEAWSIPPEGDAIPVPQEMIRKQTDLEAIGAAEFSDGVNMVIVYPRVQVGSRLRYVTRIRHHTPMFPGYFGLSCIASEAVRYDDWEFVIDAPSDLRLGFDVQGFDGGMSEECDGRKRYRFTYRNERAVPAEPGSIGDPSVRPHLDVSTFLDPVALGEAYYLASRPMAEVTPQIRTLALDITAGLQGETAMVKALHHWVAENIRYVFVGLGSGRCVPNDANHVLEMLHGDCKDHAILLEALLSAVGIESFPALVDASNRYSFSTVGVLSLVDHVITYLPSLDLYVDATDSLAVHGTLGYSVMDKPTILAGLARTGRTPTMRAEENTLVVERIVEVLPDGRLSGEATVAYGGYFEREARAARFHAQGEDHSEVIKDYLARYNESGAGVMTHPDPTCLDTPFWIKTEYLLDPTSNFPGPGAMAVPVGLSAGPLATIARSLPPQTRERPWQCQSVTIEERTILRLPLGAEVMHVPANLSLSEGPYRYEAVYRRDGNEITVCRRLVEQHQSVVAGLAEHAANLGFHEVLRRDLRAQILYR